MNCLLKALAMSLWSMCVIFECYGVVVLLWWPPVCQTVHCVPVGACASPVIPWPFDVLLLSTHSHDPC